VTWRKTTKLCNVEFLLQHTRLHPLDNDNINESFILSFLYTPTEVRVKMHLLVVTLIVIVSANISYGERAPKHSIEPPHPRYSTVDNPNIPLEYDCALRAFAIEMAAYIAPTAMKTNWTILSQSAFQMNRCNGTSYTTYQPSSGAKPFKTAPEIQKGACHHTVFVHDLKGNDLFDGTFEKPMKTVQAALSLVRALRAVHGSENTLCITIRGGTYYLGTNATTWSSQIGAIALTSNDSNLVIENYQNERVILSGGTLLQLQWSVYAKKSCWWYNYKSSSTSFSQS
jgi:hypothetical protein